MSSGDLTNLPPTFLPGWHWEDQVKKLTYRRLGQTDLKLSTVGIGGCVVGGIYPDQADIQEIFQAIETGVRSGLNYVDTSPYYGEGKSEEVLGRALRRIPRHTYYIGTKVGRYGEGWETGFDFSESRILSELENSLKRLQLSYVDIIQIHDFEFCQDPAKIARETLPVLQKIVESGKARYIGITGYPLAEFHKVLDMTNTKVDCVLSYARNIFVDMSLEKHIPLLREKGVGIINASPTGMGILTNRGPPVWHPATQQLKDLCAKAGRLCAARGVELGKLSVYHNLQNENVSTTLLGFANMEILALNMEVVQNGLTDVEREVYNELLSTLFTRGATEREGWEGLELADYNKCIGK